jgi:hypothetical protein
VLAYILTRVTPRLRSHELARYLGMRPMLVCDNLYQAEALMRQPYRLPADNIIVVPGAPGPPTGAAFKRDYVCRKVAAEGEWMAWLDDNVSCLTGLPPFLSADRLDFSAPPPSSEAGKTAGLSSWRTAFAHRLDRGEVWHYVNETISRAEKLGTINCGFSTQDNYYFRFRKWPFVGYCRTQFTLYKNDGSAWAPCPEMMWEDMYKTIDVVARYGCVVVNRHLKAVKPLFEAGGIGSLAERKPHLVKNCRWLMTNFPGLLRYNKGRDYDLTFALTTEAGVARWRKENGYA